MDEGELGLKTVVRRGLGRASEEPRATRSVFSYLGLGLMEWEKERRTRKRHVCPGLALGSSTDWESRGGQLRVCG